MPPSTFEPARFRDVSWQDNLVALFCILTIVAIGFQVFEPLFDNDAGDFDDHLWLRDAGERDTWGEIFDPSLRTGNEALDGCYLPIQGLVYHYSANVIGPRLIPARVFGIWCHVGIALLIFVLAFRLTASIPVAHLVALGFLLHPRTVGAITWLSAAVAHGLVWLLYLAAFLVLQTFLHRRTWWRLAVGIVLMLLAVMTKELATTLFAIVLLYDVLVVMGIRSLWPIRWRTIRGLLLRHGALFLVVLATVGMQLYKYEGGFVQQKFGGTSFGLRFPIRAFELLTLFFQSGHFWTPSLTMWAIAAVAAAWLAGIYLARNKGLILFLVLSIPITLTPYSFLNFRPASVLGRYTYEAGSLVLLLGGLLASKLLTKWPALRWPMLCGAVALLAFYLSSAMETLG